MTSSVKPYDDKNWLYCNESHVWLVLNQCVKVNFHNSILIQKTDARQVASNRTHYPDIEPIDI